MKILDKNNNFINIENEDLNDAKLSSKDFKEESTKKRAFINILAARLAIKMFFSKKLEASNAYSLYSIHNMLKHYDLSDIYLGNIKIDSRLVFNRNEIFVPKSHFENDITPDLYVILELKEDFTGAEFLGFFEPKDIDKTKQNKDYYFYDYEGLKSPNDIKDFMGEFEANHPEISETDFAQAEQLFLPSCDDSITNENRKYLLNQLKNSRSLRETFVEFENFEMISNATVNDDTIFNDGVLDIIGAQNVFEEEELGLKDSKAEIIGEVLTDLLDEEIGSSFSKQTADDDDDDDTLSFLEELDAEAEKSNSKSNTALETGGKILAAGAGIAGIAAASSIAATASAAEIQGSIAKTGIDAVAKAIEAGSAIIENTVSTINNIMPEAEINNPIESSDFSFEAPDETFDDISELNIDEFTDKLEEMINEPENIDNPETISLDSDVLPTTDNEFNFNEIEDLEILEETEKETSHFEALSNASFDIIDDTEDYEPVKFDYETIEEVQSEDNASISGEEISFDDIKNQTTQPSEDEEIEDIDFSSKFMIIDDEDLAAEPESKTNFEEDENEDSDESEISENVKNGTEQDSNDSSDDIEFEMDEFLKDIDIDLSEDDSTGSEDDSALFADAMNLLGEEDNNTEETNVIETENDAKNPELQMLFEGELNSEIPEIEEKEELPSSIKKDKKMVAAATIASIVLVTMVVGGSIIHNKNKANLPAPMATAPISAEGQAPSQLSTTNDGVNQTTAEQDQEALGPDLNAPSPQSEATNTQAAQGQNRDMSQAVSDVFSSSSSTPVNSNISKIAWEVPEDLAYSAGFRSYLQVAGKNLKLNLQNDLLLATEMAYTNKVVVDLGISKDGALSSVKIETSSGSKQIDGIVLRSIKETLKYLKMPTGELGGHSSVITLIVNF